MKKLLCILLLLAAAFQSSVQANFITITCSPSKSTQCGTVWSFDPPTVSSFCDGITNYTLTHTDVTSGTCIPVFTRTWIAVSTCHLTNQCSQSVTNINTNPPAMTVSSSANPSVFGQPVTFTLALSAVGSCGATPGGTVQFKVDNVAYGAPLELSGGRAVVTNAVLAPGNHSINALYAGDGCSLGATNFLVAGQTVNKASTSTTVASSLNPSAPGQPVTFIATVHAVSPSVGMPAGTVQFVIDGSNFGTPVSFTGGTAILTTSALPVGTNGVVANFNGGADYTNSFGALPGGQVVSCAPPVFGFVPVIINAISCTSTTLTYLTPTAFSACCGGPATVTVNPLSGTVFAAGTTSIVTCVATDCYGNTNITNFLVTVFRPPLAVECTPQTVTRGTPWSFDPPIVHPGCCAGGIASTNFGTLTTNLISDCALEISRTITVFDACSSVASCFQVVDIVAAPPTIACPVPNNGAAFVFTNCTSEALDPPPVTYDSLCQKEKVTVSLIRSFTNTICGQQTIYIQDWQVTDCCGNTATCRRRLSLTNCPCSLTNLAPSQRTREYNPLAGGLPDTQGWTLFQDDNGAAPQPAMMIADGILHQGMTTDQGMQGFYAEDTGIPDFNKTNVFALEAVLKIESSTWYDDGTWTYPGYELRASDSVGNTFAVLIAENGIQLFGDIMHEDMDSAPFVTMDATDDYHLYTLLISQGTAMVSVDGQFVTTYSLRPGVTLSPQPNRVMVGDASPLTHSESDLVYLVYAVIDSPLYIVCPWTGITKITIFDTATVSFAPSYGGGCDPNLTLTCQPPSGSAFAVGTTRVACALSDNCGDSVSCDFYVNVIRSDRRLYIETIPGMATLTWDFGVLQTADHPSGPWSIGANISPYSVGVHEPGRLFTISNDTLCEISLSSSNIQPVRPLGPDFAALTYAAQDFGFGPYMFYALSNSVVGVVSNSTPYAFSLGGPLLEYAPLQTVLSTLAFVDVALPDGPGRFSDPNSLFGLRGSELDIIGLNDFGAFGVTNYPPHDWTALTFAAPDLGWGPNLFYAISYDPTNHFSSLYTLSSQGAISNCIPTLGPGLEFDGLAFVPDDLGSGANRLYGIANDALGGRWFVTIAKNGGLSDEKVLFRPGTGAVHSLVYRPNPPAKYFRVFYPQ